MGFQHGAGKRIKVVFQRVAIAGRTLLPTPITHIKTDFHIQGKRTFDMEISIPIFYLNIRIGFNQSFQPKGVQ
jgi:hypothetical protein